MGRLAVYFNLASAPPGAAKSMSTRGMVVQYLVLVLGVVVQPFFAAYRAQGSWILVEGWGWVVFAAVVGVIVFPAVYRNSFDPQKPMLVQLCAVFTAGMGWESLLGTAMSAV